MTDSAPSAGVVHTELPKPSAYPSNITFFDLIRSNRRKSALLMICMCLLAVLLGAVLAAAIAANATGGDLPSLWPSALLGAAAFAIVAVIACSWSYFGGAGAILSMAGAQEIPHQRDPQLHNIVEELSIAAGIPKPRVFLIEDDSLNAFATGRDPAHSAVAITTGLRSQLSRDELAGVMAHEISHIRHYDIRFAMLMATMVGLIVFAADAFWRILWHSGRAARGGTRSSSGGKGGGNPAMLIILVIAIILAIIAPILASLIQFAISRQREYLADAGAVELTRYPQGLIGALEKLGSCKKPVRNVNRATAHLYIVNPMKSAVRGQGHELSSAFRTHPPLHNRIERLQALLHS